MNPLEWCYHSDVSPSFSPQWGWGALLLPPMGKEVSVGHTHPTIQSHSPGARVTHSNRIAASAKNFLSKSQRKKRSRLERRGVVGGWNGEGESLPRAPGDTPQTWGPWLWQGRWEPEMLPLPSCNPLPNTQFSSLPLKPTCSVPARAGAAP